MTLDALSARFRLSRDTLARHWKNHVSPERRLTYLAGPATIAALKERALAEGGTVLDHLTILRSVLMGATVIAAEMGANDPLARLSGRLLAVLEAIGKLTGEISQLQLSPSVNVVNNIAVIPDQRMADLQSGLLRIARQHPAARADLVALLRQLDDRPVAKANGAHTAPLIEHEARP